MIPLAIRKAAPTLPPKVRKAVFALVRKLRSLTGRQWKIAGLVFLVLMVAGPIWFLVYDLMGRREWKDYEAAARARGEKLYLADIEVPSIPDSENFAALPIFKNTRSINWRLPSFPLNKRPPFAWAHAGFRFDENRWRTYFARAGWIDTPSTEPTSDLRLVLVRYDDVIEEVTEGLKRPHCSFGITWAPNPYSTSMPYRSVITRLMDAVTLRANVHLAEGDSAAALEDLRLISGIRDRLSSAVRDGTESSRPMLARRRVDVVYEGLARHAWSQEQLRDIIELLSDFDPLKDMADWFEMQRVIANERFAWTQAGNVPPASIFDEYRPEIWFQNAEFLQTFPGVVRRNHLQVAKYYSTLLAQIDLAAGVSGETRPGYRDCRYYWLADDALDSVAVGRHVFLVHTIRSRLAVIACALELYHARHSVYPQQLADLVPSCLPTLPHEPTSQQEFIYYPADDGRYRLYSRGPNGEDERGMLGFIPDEDDRRPRDHKMIDVPWIAPPPR